MTRREKTRWLLAAAWVILIYSTLYSVRPVATFLRERNLLRLTVGIVLAAAALAILSFLIKRRPRWREWTVVTTFAALYLWFYFLLSIPEERIHILEYGLLAALIYAALAQRLPPPQATGKAGAPLRTPVITTVLTGLLGWADEGIQHLLPNRYYELRDAGLNLLAGALAAAAIYLSSLARHRDRNSR